MIEVIKQIKKTIIVFLIESLFFNKIIIPNPAFINNPDKSAPNGKALLRYNSEIRTLPTQLGIIPIIEVNKGVKYRLETMKFANVASPTYAINKPKPTLMTKTNKNISKE